MDEDEVILEPEVSPLELLAAIADGRLEAETGI